MHCCKIPSLLRDDKHNTRVQANEKAQIVFVRNVQHSLCTFCRRALRACGNSWKAKSQRTGAYWLLMKRSRKNRNDWKVRPIVVFRRTVYSVCTVSKQSSYWYTSVKTTSIDRCWNIKRSGCNINQCRSIWKLPWSPVNSTTAGGSMWGSIFTVLHIGTAVISVVRDVQCVHCLIWCLRSQLEANWMPLILSWSRRWLTGRWWDMTVGDKPFW